MTANNLALKTSSLNEFLFSLEDILGQVEVREHIFELKNEEGPLGHISLYDLKSYISTHEEEAQEFQVKGLDQDHWIKLFEHPYFQRRKPQLISSETLKEEDDQEFFILQKGQKMGPYEKFELMDMVEKREILLTDMVSYNGGHTWNKLYQIDGFDRRTLKESDQLPGMPSADFLKRPNESVHHLGETTEAITSLAFLGNQKRGKTIERERDNTYSDEMSKKASTSSLYKWLLMLSVMGIIYFLYSIKGQLSSPFEKNQSSGVGEKAEMLSPVQDLPETSGKPSANNVFDQGRSSKFQSRHLNPVRPARTKKSFMETQKYQDSVRGDSGSEDNNYYYDNASPMELDPVRAQISKENFDNGGTERSSEEGLFNQEISN